MSLDPGSGPDRWVEPARSLPIVARPDVLVVGAGCAGLAAAIAAATQGADTLLVEATTRIGGLATAGLINLLLTLDDGAGHQVVGGLCQSFVDDLVARGRAFHPPPAEWNSEAPELLERYRRWGLIWGAPESVRYSVAYDPEAFVDVALERLTKAGARLLMTVWVAGVAMEADRIAGVYIESKRGREVVIPRVVVDCSGDADVAVAAGAAFETVSIPPHLWFRVGGASTHASGPFAFDTVDRGRLLIPWGPLDGRVDATDPGQVTEALLAGRRSAAAAFSDLKQSSPDWSQAWLDDYATMLGITESRRLVGDYVLAKEDADRPFEDTVASTGHWTRRNVVFEVPYRSLRTASVSNLLVAGRCISTTRYVHQATKEIPAAMATGEAAGLAAAIAVHTDGRVGDVDVGLLRRKLRAAGALL